MKTYFTSLFLVASLCVHASAIAQTRTDLHSKLQQVLQTLSQDPASSLQRLDELQTTPGFVHYPDLHAELLQARCFSLMNLGRYSESADTAHMALKLISEHQLNIKTSRLLVCQATQQLEDGLLNEGWGSYAQALLEAKENPELKAFVLQYRAQFHLKYNSLDEAISDLQEAYELYNLSTGYEGQAHGVLMNLGFAYKQLRDYRSAVTYFEKALNFFAGGNYPFIEARILHHIGDTYLAQSKPENAVDYLLRSEAINHEIRNEQAVLANYLALGKAFLVQDQADVAMHYLSKGLPLATSLGHSSAIIDIGTLSAGIDLNNDSLTALAQLEELLQYPDISHMQQIAVYELLIAGFRKSGDTARMSDYLQRLLNLERRLFSDNVQQQATQLHLRFSLQLAEKENALLRLEAEKEAETARFTESKLLLARTLTLASVIVLFILASFSYLLWIQHKKVKAVTLTDELTAIPNRRHIMSELKSHVQLVARYQTPAAIGIIDIDHFKSINDTYGHPFGDQVLIAVAARCQKMLRRTDVLGRLGGEEFLFILPHTDLTHAIQLAERIRTEIEKVRFQFDEGYVSITISIGMTGINQTDTPHSCYDRADKALYTAKASGRNQVCYKDLHTPSNLQQG